MLTLTLALALVTGGSAREGHVDQGDEDESDEKGEKHQYYIVVPVLFVFLNDDWGSDYSTEGLINKGAEGGVIFWLWF